MKAIAMFPRSKAIRLIQEDEPRLAGAGSVKARVLEVGVCGTDREIAAFQYGEPPEGRDRLVVGHESLVRVVEVGPEVRRVRPGDLAVLMVRRPCARRDCAACRLGRPDFCYTGDYTERGIKGRDGYLAEVVVDEEAYVVPVPPDLRDVGVLTEPLTIAEKAIEELRRVQMRLPWGWPEPTAAGTYRHTAAVLGAGPVGLLGAMALAIRGFEVHVYSREPAGDPRARLAAAVGARYVSAGDASIDAFAEGVGHIDLVYEAAGAARASFEMLERLGVNGAFVFTGVPVEKPPFDVMGSRIMRNLVLRNQVVFGTVNAPRAAYEAAVRDLGAFRQRWPEAVRALITSRADLREAPARLSHRAAGGIKEVIRVAETT